MSAKYDVIVIGSGIGGLTTAAILTKLFKKKVLVLEKHYVLGGFTHSFERKRKYHWDVGVHYIGDCSDGSKAKQLFDYISDGQAKFQKLPEPFDTAIFPDFKFEFPSKLTDLEAKLIEQFPHETQAIKQYFIDIQTVLKWQGRYNIDLATPPAFSGLANLIPKPGSKLAMMTTKEYLDKNFTDEKLKALICTRWDNYGVTPSKSAFFVDCANTAHFDNGAYFPVGGGQVLADSIVKVIEGNGGEVLSSHSVEDIIVEKGRAIGVKVLSGMGAVKEPKEFLADTIISDAGAYNTYVKLLTGESQQPFVEEVKNFPTSMAHVNLYLGLKSDPRVLGLSGGNLWIRGDYQLDKPWDISPEAETVEFTEAFVSFGSLRGDGNSGYTAEILTHANIEDFAEWKDTEWHKRGGDYNEFKARISQGLIDLMEKTYPGFADLIEFQELSTPLSTVHFNHTPRGSAYGLAAVPERYTRKWISPYTPIKNLYMTGADAGAMSVLGATYTGLLTAGVVTGIPGGFQKIFKEVVNLI